MSTINRICLLAMCAIHIVLASPAIKGEECNHTCLINGTCRSKRSEDSCFYLFPKVLTNWQENYDFCKNKKLIMAQLSSKTLDHGFEIKIILQNFSYYNFKEGLWLGGRAKNTDEWRFMKGNGRKQFPEEFDVEYQGSNYTKCGFVNSSTLEVGVQECWKKAYAICRYESCLNNTPCLGFLPIEETWFSALSHCTRGGGNLFYFDDDEDFLLDELNKTLHVSLQDDARVHIGLIHRKWLWNDGSQILHYNWRERRPNSSEESCIMMDGNDSLWEDEPCSAVKMTFCQNDSKMKSTTDDTTRPKQEKKNYFHIVAIILGGFLALSVLVNVIVAIGFMCMHYTKKPEKSFSASIHDTDVIYQNQLQSRV